jgi:hypothetical protein
MNNKKNEELHYLKTFLTLYTLSKAKIIANTESPDFIIDYLNKKIGIELTTYHSLPDLEEYSKREVESNWERLQSNIFKRVQIENGLAGVFVNISFRKKLMPSSREKEYFIDELIGFVKTNLHKETESFSILADDKPLNKYVRKIIIKKINVTQHLKWNSNINVGSIGLHKESLLSIVRSKIRKENAYLSKNIDELWLLVVFGYRISQSAFPKLKHELEAFIDLDLILKKSKFKHGFLYLYSYDVIYRWPVWEKFCKGVFYNIK